MKKGDEKKFLKKVFSILNKYKIDVSKFELDHIAYRTEGIEKYNLLRKKLIKDSVWNNETMIAGRPISVFELKKPIIFENRDIKIIELIPPKEGNKYSEGWQHVEFVIDCGLEEFMKTYPEVEFDISDETKNVNPDISIKFEDFVVKFHRHNLKYVIEHLQ